ncbi:hypothetical protein M0804_012418 [Polistes exclamans]|nr:hypothetical protein M0804_012418 [Polistes exclamans]
MWMSVGGGGWVSNDDDYDDDKDEGWRRMAWVGSYQRRLRGDGDGGSGYGVACFRERVNANATVKQAAAFKYSMLTSRHATTLT